MSIAGKGSRTDLIVAMRNEPADTFLKRLHHRTDVTAAANLSLDSDTRRSNTLSDRATLGGSVGMDPEPGSLDEIDETILHSHHVRRAAPRVRRGSRPCQGPCHARMAGGCGGNIPPAAGKKGEFVLYRASKTGKGQVGDLVDRPKSPYRK